MTSSTLSGGTYNAGEPIEVTISFDEPVAVTGAPEAELEIGTRKVSAVYNRGSGTKDLVFRYIVRSGDTDTDGIEVAANALAKDSDLSLGELRGGGTIRSLADGDHAEVTSSAVLGGPNHKVAGGQMRLPEKPADLAAAANGATQIDLTWTAPDAPTFRPVTGYRIEVSDDGGRTWTDLSSDTGNTDTAYSHTGLSGGDERHYRVSALNSAGTGPASDEASAQTVPAVWIAARKSPVTEGENAEFVLRLVGTASDALTVAVAVTEDGEVIDRSDGYAAPTEAVIAANTPGAALTVQTQEDETHEGTGTITVTVQPGTGYVVGTPAEAAVAVEDDDRPMLSVNDAETEEGGELEFTVTLDPPSDRDQTVEYTTRSGPYDTTDAADYEHTSEMLRFPAGTATKTVRVMTRDDASDEADETMTLALMNPSFAFLADGGGTGTIRDDDDPPTIAVAAAIGAEDRTIDFTVTLSTASGRTVTVDWSPSTEAGDTAEAGDYASAGGTLKFAPGQTTQSVRVPALSDTDTDNETFTLTLSNPVNATIATATATGTIIDAEAHVMRSIEKNLGAETEQSARDIGAPVTDAENTGTLVYSLSGTDAGKFDIDPANGQLRTKVGERYDHERQESHDVVVQIDDGTSEVLIAVTIEVADRTDEQPLAPETPTVRGAGATSLFVSWPEPDSTGRPEIEGYDVRYRAGTGGAWTEGPQDVTARGTHIRDLAEDTSYQVQVRAQNSDGEGPWSGTAGARTYATGTQTGVLLDTTLMVADLRRQGDIMGCASSSNAWDCKNRLGQNTFVSTDADGMAKEFAITDLQLTHVGWSQSRQRDLGKNLVIAFAGVRELRDYEVDNLMLVLDGRSFRFLHSDAGGYQARTWWNTGLDWKRGDFVQVRILDRRLAGQYAEPSAESSLSGLTLSDRDGNAIALSPAFASGTVNYEAGAGNAVNEITLAATPADGYASVEYLDASDTVIVDADPDATGLQVALDVGATTIRIKVTADDGMTVETYTVTVTRAPCDALWCATLTVRDLGGGDRGCANSSSAARCSSPDHLTRDAFRLEATDHTVTAVRVGQNGQLQLSVSPDVAADAPNLVLDVGAVTFGFPAADIRNANNWRWNGSGLDWSAGKRVYLRLSVKEKAAEGVLRLVQHPNDPQPGVGRLEVYHDNRWGTVCNDHWDDPNNIAPALACRFLGYAAGEVLPASVIPPAPASRPIWLDDVRCLLGSTHGTGRAPTKLSDCFHAGWGLNNCTRAEDVVLRCGREEEFALQRKPLQPLTVEIDGMPQSHDGTNPFTFRFAFSEDVAIESGDMRDHALQVIDGTVTGASKVDGKGDFWEMTLQPAGDRPVGIIVPLGRPCAEQGALCTADGRMLSGTIPALLIPHASATRQQQETGLTATFENVPEEHDGTNAFTLRLTFSHEPRLSLRTLRDQTLSATGGTVRGARRAAQGQNALWDITVQPDGNADVTLTLAATAPCGEAGAICTADGRALANAPAVTVKGPPGLAVADAEAEEGPGAALEFAVTLSRASSSDVTVDYATADGSAVADADYIATSGRLLFAAGETAKTVAVPVIDDSIDEGIEKMTLILSNPSGGNAFLSDATANGTIRNNDPMPRAWLARFGRTVAEQIVDAVQERVQGPPGAGVQVMLAGERIGSDSGPGGEDPGSRTGTGDKDAEAARKRALEEAEAKQELAALSAWLGGETGAEDGERVGNRQGYRPVEARELLTGSSFQLTTEADGSGGGIVSLWGRGAWSSFEGRESELSLSGQVASALIGADWTKEIWTAGLMLSHARGEGTFQGASSGNVESTVTGLYPYGRYRVNDRVMVWGTAGYGTGNLTLRPDEDAPLSTGLDLMMTAAGLRGVVLNAPAEGGPEVAVETDALAVRTRSEALRSDAGNLAVATGDATRLRLGLEAVWHGLETAGGTLEPRLELGLRRDGGDAETGFGLDAGAGLAWIHPQNGLQLQLSGRGLLTHESKGFREQGVAGSLDWQPRPERGRGPKLTLTQTLGGAASGGASALLGRRTLAGLAANDTGDPLERRNLKLGFGYGFAALGGRFTFTPEIGFGMSNSSREYSLGWRLTRDMRGDAVALELALEASRREAVGPGWAVAEAEHAVRFRVTAHW